jgi:subtilisin family serine protease
LSSQRKVENVFDVSRNNGNHIPEDNDFVGHGTHTAATAGGLNTGVAPKANIYGVKVLNDEGKFGPISL